MTDTQPKTIPYHEADPGPQDLVAYRTATIATSSGSTVKIGVPEDVDKHAILHIFTKPDKDTGNNVELKFSLSLEACVALATLYASAELDRKFVQGVQVAFTEDATK